MARLSGAGELALVEMLRSRFKSRSERISVGIGDDAAVVRGENKFLLTTDMMVEGIHFDLSWITPFQLGFKLVSVNISDIYAMGGIPLYVLLNFAAPGRCSTSFFDEFFSGIKEALRLYKASLIGGDISASDRIMLSVTAAGHAGRVVRRRGAKIGDRIYVTGMLGDSACGLEILKRVKRTIDFNKASKKGLPVPWHIAEPMLRRHLMPLARDPKSISKKATAMIDVSDGLLLDISRLCGESGKGALIKASEIPVSASLRAGAEALGISALDLALSGGEDYELLFTAPLRSRVPGYCIGEIVDSGIAVVDDNGAELEISSGGYQHFSLQG